MVFILTILLIGNNKTNAKEKEKTRKDLLQTTSHLNTSPVKTEKNKMSRLLTWN